MTGDRSITLHLHERCTTCTPQIEKLRGFFENRPWKYGCRAVIEVRQDFLGGGWHLHEVAIDNREANDLREEHDKAVAEGRDYDLQGLLNNLSWGGHYSDE
jgi:hypothetical protein